MKELEVTEVSAEDEREFNQHWCDLSREQFKVYKELCERHPELTTVGFMVDWQPRSYHLSRDCAFFARMTKDHALISLEKLWLN